jgi:hypothetical protein
MVPFIGGKGKKDQRQNSIRVFIVFALDSNLFEAMGDSLTVANI